MKEQVSRTVYALYLPETKQIVDRLWNEKPHFMYEEAYSKKQDQYHVSFLNEYKIFSASDVNVNWTDFPFEYPTNGSSEAIREQIAYLKAQNINTMYVLEGEYEGYEAIAIPLGFKVVKLSHNLEVLMSTMYEKDSVFFLSQPNSAFGNIWSDYDAFLSFMNEHNQHVRFYVDLTYLGNVITVNKVNITYDNIDGVFFSLSKTFGVYYHRIGGCFLKKANPLLYGNMWFKNLFSLRLGETLMRELNKNEIVSKYKQKQLEAIKMINENIKPSDVWLIGTIEVKHLDQEMLSLLKRFENNTQRLCLTQQLDAIINNKE